MPTIKDIEHLLGPVSEIPPTDPRDLYRDPSPEAMQERRDHRLATCGFTELRTDPATGKPYRTPCQCRDSRCDYCNGVRAEHFKERADRAAHEHPLNVVYLPDNEETDALLKKIGKENYLRLPGEEQDTIFVNADHEVGATLGKSISRFELNALDWDKIMERQEGRKISGTVGRQTISPVLEENTLTYTEYIVHAEHCDEHGNTVSGMTNEEADKVEEQALVETIDLNPQNDTELNVAMLTFAEAKARACIRLGLQNVTVRSYQVTTERFLHNWKPLRDNVRRKLALSQLGLLPKAA